jgi:hypothetical protein
MPRVTERAESQPGEAQGAVRAARGYAAAHVSVVMNCNRRIRMLICSCFARAPVREEHAPILWSSRLGDGKAGLRLGQMFDWGISGSRASALGSTVNLSWQWTNAMVIDDFGSTAPQLSARRCSEKADLGASRC